MKIFPLGLLGMLLFSASAIAQDVPRFPGTIQNKNNLNLDRKQNFPTLDKVTPTPLETQPDITLPTPSVLAVEFQIQGNTAFSDEELQTLIQPFLNQELRKKDLENIGTEISQYYAQKGYLEVNAFISDIKLSPSSSSNQAVVMIQVLERTVSDIQINGAKGLTPFIRSRIRHYLNRPFNSSKFINEIRFLVGEDAIEFVRAEFIPTDLANEGLLQVDITLSDIVELTATLDNWRSPSFGELERSIDFIDRNLTRRGDTLNLLYKNTDGSHFAEANYDIPVNANGGSVSMSVNFERSSIIREPIDEFDLDSESFRLSAAFRQPIIQKSDDSKTEEVAIGVAIRHTDTRESFDDDPFPLSAGTTLDGEFRSTVLNLFQEYSRKGSRTILLWRSDLDIGLPVGATNDPFFNDGSFVKGRMQGLLLHRINNWVSLLSRWNGQISNRSLTNSEQYSLGGQNAVRGADLNIGRDYGISASQEIRGVLSQSREYQLVLAPFLDIGYAANQTPQVFQDNLLLASLGVVLRLQLYDRFFASLTYAQPILGRDSFQDGSDFKFSLSGRIF